MKWRYPLFFMMTNNTNYTLTQKKSQTIAYILYWWSGINKKHNNRHQSKFKKVCYFNFGTTYLAGSPIMKCIVNLFVRKYIDKVKGSA